MTEERTCDCTCEHEQECAPEGVTFIDGLTIIIGFTIVFILFYFVAHLILELN
jgi:hypothetical protein